MCLAFENGKAMKFSRRYRGCGRKISELCESWHGAHKLAFSPIVQSASHLVPTLIDYYFTIRSSHSVCNYLDFVAHGLHTKATATAEKPTNGRRICYTKSRFLKPNWKFETENFKSWKNTFFLTQIIHLWCESGVRLYAQHAHTTNPIGKKV